MGMSNEYQRAHRAVVKARGKAREYPCHECGLPALEWAYQHNDPDERRDSHGLLFSLEPRSYEPMCRPCHHQFDAQFDTPEYRKTQKEHLDRVRKMRGYDSEVFVKAARQNIAKALAAVDRTDPVFLSKMREAGRKTASIKRRCSCGKESNPAGIKSHQKASGHTGHDDMIRYAK